MAHNLVQLDGSLAADEVHFWVVGHDINELEIARLFELLNQEEQARAERFKVSEPRKQFIISRATLRTILGKYLKLEPEQVVLRVGMNSKPELGQHTDLRFNLSHTDGKTAIGITRGRNVGVDVERIRENLDPLELAQRFFSPRESQWLRAQPAASRYSAFFACWTAKEAYVKACGIGLSMPLAEFGVRPEEGNLKVDFEIYGKPEESKQWTLWQPDLGSDFRSAVAVAGQNMTLCIGDFSR